MISKKAYFVCEEDHVVERLKPHTFVVKPLLLGSDALVHVLHRQAYAMREVTEDFFNINDLPPGVGHRIEAHLLQRASLISSARMLPTWTLGGASLPSSACFFFFD